MDRNKQSEVPLTDRSHVSTALRNPEDGRRRKNTCGRIERYFRDYCDNSSIIGFKFLGEKRSVGERILWFVIIVIAIALSIHYILELYYKYEENPFIVNLATRESPIFTIPFPAVTICPVVKTEKHKFNFTRAVHKIWNNESLTEDELINTQYFSLFCENIDDSYKEQLPANETFTEDFFDRLDYLGPSKSDIFFLCSFMGEEFECEDLFVPVLLDDGICYTFNMIDRNDIYKSDVVQFDNFLKIQNRTDWTIDEGYAKGTGRNAYPKRALLAGADSALDVFLFQSIGETDYLCCSEAPGFNLVLHTPHTIPQLKKLYHLVPVDTSVQVVVQPKMMTTSREVKGYRPTDRQCYFTDERPLQYFKIYTPENCKLECLTNYTLGLCGCVNFYMPRINSTPICGNGQSTCMDQAIYAMKELEVESMLEKLDNPDVACNCMPLCSELTYNIETSRTTFPWKQKMRAEKKFLAAFEKLYFNISDV